MLASTGCVGVGCGVIARKICVALWGGYCQAYCRYLVRLSRGALSHVSALIGSCFTYKGLQILSWEELCTYRYSNSAHKYVENMF